MGCIIHALIKWQQCTLHFDLSHVPFRQFAFFFWKEISEQKCNKVRQTTTLRQNKSPFSKDMLERYFKLG